jgi:tetratricopeptide (TPR) repeat protein
MSRKKKPIKGKPSDTLVGGAETATASRKWPVKFTLLLLILICSAAGLFLYRNLARTLPPGFPALPDVTQASPVVREVLQRADTNARVHPDSAEALGSLAMTYHANQFFENAKLAYQLAARSDPNDYRWFYCQALLEEDTAHAEAFVGLLEKTIQLQDYLPALQKLADLFFKEDQLQKANSLYTHILEKDPSFLQAALGLARAAARKGDWSQVVQRLEPLAQQQPQLRPIQQMLADAYQALGRRDQASERHKKLGQATLVLLPPVKDLLRDQLDDLCCLSTPLLKLAYSAESGGDYEKMLQLSRRAVRVDATDADAQHFLARSLILARGAGADVLNEAMVHRDEGLRLRVDYPDPLMMLGQALIDRNSFKAAILQFEMLLSRKPEHAEAHSAMGIALTGEGKFAEATGHFLQAIRLKPEYAEAHNNLGNLFFQQRNWKESQVHYSRALELKPDYAEAHYNMGNAFAQEGKLEQATRCFSAALELKPDHAQAHNGLGVALLQQGKIEPAIAHFSDASKFAPDFAQAQYNWGLALARGEKFDEACLHFAEALRIRPDYLPAQQSLQTVRAQQTKGLAKTVGTRKH